MLTYAHVCSRMLTYAHVWLTYAHVWLTYSDVCSRMLPYAELADSESQSKELEAMLQALEASARMLTYAQVC